jgi:hypothetical protein|tara:strand:+ start:1243 stop:1434 length:192 start_codon:yes stop_codon:yes gene_type:complete
MIAAAKYITKELHIPGIPASFNNLTGYHIKPHIPAEKRRQSTAKLFPDDILILMEEPYTTRKA